MLEAGEPVTTIAGEGFLDPSMKPHLPAVRLAVHEQREFTVSFEGATRLCRFMLAGAKNGPDQQQGGRKAKTVCKKFGRRIDVINAKTLGSHNGASSRASRCSSLIRIIKTHSFGNGAFCRHERTLLLSWCDAVVVAGPRVWGAGCCCALEA